MANCEISGKGIRVVVSSRLIIWKGDAVKVDIFFKSSRFGKSQNKYKIKPLLNSKLYSSLDSMK